MIFITSGAYVDSEFRNEFGLLPPALLPIGNRRLFQWQAELLSKHFPNERKALSLPESFQLQETDSTLLAKYGVEVISVPEPLSLGESVLSAINAVGAYDEPIRILHGDTLIDDLPPGLDVISVSTAFNDYEWEYEEGEDHAGTVWAGYFAFSRPRLLIQQLVGQRGDFVGAIRAYGRAQKLARQRTEHWKDFGHINTYFDARMRLTTERAFNSLSIVDRVVTKRSEKNEKIRSEARWFKELPNALRLFTPQLINFTDSEQAASYSLEYLCLPPLNEIFVHGAKPAQFWQKIFTELDRWFELAARLADRAPPDFEKSRLALLADKSIARITQYAEQSGFSIDQPLQLNGESLPSLSEITQTLVNEATQAAGIPGILHGDLCLSNILYDSRSQGLKVIDPRGLSESAEATLVGDIAYDFAKLAHSVIGLYDHIIAGAYRCKVTAPGAFEFTPQIDMRIHAIQVAFLKHVFGGRMTFQAYASHVTLLFISMLPLHYDDKPRQDTLLANALRLFKGRKMLGVVA